MSLFAFQADNIGSQGTGHSPEPGRQTPPSEPGALPEREWELSAIQVLAVVVAIIATCEVIGALF